MNYGRGSTVLFFGKFIVVVRITVLIAVTLRHFFLYLSYQILISMRAGVIPGSYAVLAQFGEGSFA